MTQSASRSRATTRREPGRIFTWQEVRPLSASLTLQCDKVLYLIEPSPENQETVATWPTEFDKLTHQERSCRIRDLGLCSR
jgi:hypothetical protein